MENLELRALNFELNGPASEKLGKRGSKPPTPEIPETPSRARSKRRERKEKNTGKLPPPARPPDSVLCLVKEQRKHPNDPSPCSCVFLPALHDERHHLLPPLWLVSEAYEPGLDLGPRPLNQAPQTNFPKKCTPSPPSPSTLHPFTLHPSPFHPSPFALPSSDQHAIHFCLRNPSCPTAHPLHLRRYPFVPFSTAFDLHGYCYRTIVRDARMTPDYCDPYPSDLRH